MITSPSIVSWATLRGSTLYQPGESIPGTTLAHAGPPLHVFGVLPVDEPAVGCPRGLGHRLGKCGVGVDRAGHLLEAALEVVGHHELLDHVRRLHTHDVGAQELAVLLVAHDLDHAAAVAVDGRGANRAHRHLAHHHLVTGVPGLLLGHPEAGHL